MAKRRRGRPEDWFHRADMRIPPVPPPVSDDAPADRGNAVRKAWSVFNMWRICPLGRCRRARLCLSRRELTACNEANRELVRPHHAFMRETLARAMAGKEREETLVIPGRSRAAAEGKGSQGPPGGAAAPGHLRGPAGRLG